MLDDGDSGGVDKDIDLDASDDLRPLSLKLSSITCVRLLLAVFQTAALVVFQQTVLAAEVAVAKGAVTHDALSRLSAVLGGATELLSRHDGRESGSEKARMKAKKGWRGLWWSTSNDALIV